MSLSNLIHALRKKLRYSAYSGIILPCFFKTRYEDVKIDIA